MFREPSNRRLAALGAIALAAVVALVVLLLAGSGSKTPARVTLHKRHTPLISIFEGDAQVGTDPLAALKLLRSFGVDRVRVFVPWGALDSRPAIAPDPTSRKPPPGFDTTNPSAYPPSDWAQYDAIDRAAAQVGIGLYFELGPPAPLWAVTRGAPPHVNPNVWKVSARQFGRFVRAVGTRYSGSYAPPGSSIPLPRVNFWGLWNEPNYGVDLAPQAVDHGAVEVAPMFYRRMVDAGWSALNATGHGRDTILIDELAPRGVISGVGNANGMMPLRFLRALYCVDSSYRLLTGTAAIERGCPSTASASARFAADNPPLFEATGVSIHPYPQAQAPNVRTPGFPDYADLPVMHNVERVLDRLQLAYGSHHRFPIYSTEYGYKTNPPYTLGGVPVKTAAYYLNWAEYISWRDPRIRSYSQYLLTDPPPTGSSEFDTGLETFDRRPKLTLDAYRMPLYLPVRKVTPSRPLEVWGCVRPAPQARRQTHRPQEAEIQFQRAGAGSYATVSDVRVQRRSCYFDVAVKFPGPGLVRLRWVDQKGEALHSRNVSLAAG